jgi:hypothetical protein
MGRRLIGNAAAKKQNYSNSIWLSHKTCDFNPHTITARGSYETKSNADALIIKKRVANNESLKITNAFSDDLRDVLKPRSSTPIASQSKNLIAQIQKKKTEDSPQKTPTRPKLE